MCSGQSVNRRCMEYEIMKVARYMSLSKFSFHLYIL